MGAVHTIPNDDAKHDSSYASQPTTPVSPSLSAKHASGIHIGISMEEKPAKVGYLLKRGFKNFGSWKRRYCILLENGYFNYYNSKKKIKGSVNFGNAHQCISCNKDSKKFYVLTNKRTWEFKAESKAEALQWIQFILKAMKKEHHTAKSAASRTNSSKASKASASAAKRQHHHAHQHPARNVYNQYQAEFDSDDEDDTESKHSSSYMRKHQKRRSTVSSYQSYKSHNTMNSEQQIVFESWKISVSSALQDVLQTVQQRENAHTHHHSKHEEHKDTLHIIADILRDDEKLKKIFYRITNNKPWMSMKQYVASMSLIQNSKAEISSVATRLLNESNQQHYQQASMPPVQEQEYFDVDFQKQSCKIPEFDTQSMVSTLSTLSARYNNKFDDTQSIISDLSISRQRRSRMKYSRVHRNPSLSLHNQHSVKLSFTRQNSILSNIDGPFSILDSNTEYNKGNFSDDELNFDELMLNEADEEEDEEQYGVLDTYNEETSEPEPDEEDDEIRVENDAANIRVEIPSNAAAEILGNFLSASCGLCVPGLDVITSLETAETHQLLAEYTNNYDASGKAPTLLVYEELPGVSLADLKKQLEAVPISIHYTDNASSSAQATTNQQIQKYFVSVVRKTFGPQLPYHFSHDGRSMIRDAGFVFAVDMFLYNVGRFPVLLPFEGVANADNLFISTDEDDEAALYGLKNSFMGGHDIIETPFFILNGGNTVYDEQTTKLLLDKQKEYTSHYLLTLQKFLSTLSDYYKERVAPNIDSKKNNNKANYHHNPHVLLHGQPRKHNKNKFAQIDHHSIVDKCLRPIANFLYLHCGFELIIIDEYNRNPTLMSPAASFNDLMADDGTSTEEADKAALKVLEVYRNKLIDNMITLLCEGILIGIHEISDQLETKDIDAVIHDIKTLDENMFGIQLISPEFLKLVLRLFHSTAVSFQLNIEDSSSEDEDDENDNVDQDEDDYQQ